MKIEITEKYFAVPEHTSRDIMLQDLYHMGISLGTNVLILHANHTTESAKYLKIVDLSTGDVVTITFPLDKPNQ